MKPNPIVLLLAALLFAAPTRPTAAGVDHGLFAGLLQRHVQDGVVDYAGFQDEEDLLDRYLKVLEKTDLDRLAAGEKFAFYVNAYNAWTIKLILTEYPQIESIRELGFFNLGPWKKKVVKVGGRVISLDGIRGSTSWSTAHRKAVRRCCPSRLPPTGSKSSWTQPPGTLSTTRRRITSRGGNST